MIEVLNTCSCAFIVKAGHVIQLLFLIFWRTDTQDIRNSGIRHLQPQIQPLGSAITFKLIAPQISKKTKQTQTPRNRHVRNVSAVIRNSRILNILTYLTNNKKWNLKIFFYLMHPMSFTSHWLHGTLFSVLDFNHRAYRGFSELTHHHFCKSSWKCHHTMLEMGEGWKNSTQHRSLHAKTRH